MEMEESEGHISIQIASILAAIHLAWLGQAAADFLLWGHLHIFTDLSPLHEKTLCVQLSLIVSGTRTHTNIRNTLSVARNTVAHPLWLFFSCPPLL